MTSWTLSRSDSFIGKYLLGLPSASCCSQFARYAKPDSTLFRVIAADGKLCMMGF